MTFLFYNYFIILSHFTKFFFCYFVKDGKLE